MRLALVAGADSGQYSRSAYDDGVGEMVEAASAYANAPDGVDNLGYVRDVDNRTEKRQQQQLLQSQAQPGKPAKRTVQPVIHFPKPPAGQPSSPSASSSSGRYVAHLHGHGVVFFFVVC